MPSKLLRLLFWAALIFAFGAALMPRPPQIPGDPSDKAQHIVAFLTLAALAVAAYPRARLLRIGILLSAFGAAIEFFQLIPDLHRDGDVADWAADTAAIAVVLTLAALVRRRRKAARF